MAQRICQQYQIVSLNAVKFCKDLQGDCSRHTYTTCKRPLDSVLTPLWGPRVSQVLPLFRFTFSSATTLSIACGKRCENSMVDMSARTSESTSGSFDHRVFTLDQRLPTQSQQLLTRYLCPQQLSVQGDSELTKENHQNLRPLLSSKTVIKYSSHTERGRTTTPCFKRTAP